MGIDIGRHSRANEKHKFVTKKKGIPVANNDIDPHAKINAGLGTVVTRASGYARGAKECRKRPIQRSQRIRDRLHHDFHRQILSRAAPYISRYFFPSFSQLTSPPFDITPAAAPAENDRAIIIIR